MNPHLSFKSLLKVSALLILLGMGNSALSQYKSLLWKVSGKNLKKPSFLYGTMHVSGKVAFQLGDPFYDAMQSVDVVALELEPEAWLEALFHDPEVLEWMHGQTYFDEGYDEYASDSPLPPLAGYWSLGGGISAVDRIREALLYEPDILNYLMFRYSDDNSAIDYEEDTWLDMHIYQAAKKLGLHTSGLETYE
ncbi:MAG: TraB/GumN family protein, partial [Flavobacteriales bacterium]